MQQHAQLHEYTCFAMNTGIETILESSSTEMSLRLNSIVQSWFHTTESRFSRFLSDSELTFLNSHSGKLVLLSPLMVEVLSLAETYRKETQGLFTPYVYDALLAAGYDRSFEEVKKENTVDSPPPQRIEPSMSLHTGMKAVQLQPGTRIDLGGIVKGWSAERLFEKLYKKHSVKRGLINAGGDLQVWGGSSHDEPWHIGITSPLDREEEMAIVSLVDGAVATSSVLGRRWKHERGGEMHHIIDPRTMQPSTSDVAQCSIVGDSLTQCEIWAKVVCIVGIEQAISLLKTYVPRSLALIVSKTGDVHFCGDQRNSEMKWEVETVHYFH